MEPKPPLPHEIFHGTRLSPLQRIKAFASGEVHRAQVASIEDQARTIAGYEATIAQQASRIMELQGQLAKAAENPVLREVVGLRAKVAAIGVERASLADERTRMNEVASQKAIEIAASQGVPIREIPRAITSDDSEASSGPRGNQESAALMKAYQGIADSKERAAFYAANKDKMFT